MTMGVTWTQARPLEVPNPNSGIDAVALRDGRVVLVYNHPTSGRTPQNHAVSNDREHFKMFYTLEESPGEYSYPAIIRSSERRPGDDLHLEPQDHRACSLSSGGSSKVED